MVTFEARLRDRPTRGDITYIGTCDATVDSDSSKPGTQNTVTLWVDGLYNGAGTADVGEWRDPCPATGCKLEVDCNENADTLAAFDFTIMRDANQGFFDVAVNFEDIFCSAKVDCEYASGQPIELLHHPDTGVRGQTAVLAFACTAGPSAAPATTLVMDTLQLLCDPDPTDAIPPTVYPIDPSTGPGELYTASNADPDPTDPIWQVATYRGAEQLPCTDADGAQVSCDKLYWNVAVGFDVTAAGCALVGRASAGDGATVGFGSTPDHATYPYVNFGVPLTGPTGGRVCTADPLNGEGSGVFTRYTPIATPASFCYGYDGAAAVTYCGANARRPAGSPAPEPQSIIVAACDDYECYCYAQTASGGYVHLSSLDSFQCFMLADVHVYFD